MNSRSAVRVRPTLKFPFLASIIVLSGLCFFLGTLKAAPEANEKPAVTSAEVPCADWRKPSQFEEAWEKVSFAKACQAHEACYQASGTSWSSCNTMYLKELRQACDAAFTAGAAGNTDAATMPSLAVCYDVADQYYSRVQRPMALRKYQAAQSSLEGATFAGGAVE